MATDPYSFSPEFYEELLEKGRCLKAAEKRIIELEAFIREAGIVKILGKDTSGTWNKNLHRRVDELELSVRAQNALQNAGMEFIWQLVEKSEADMLKTKNFGRKTLNEIKEILNELGLSLGTRLNGFVPPL